MSTKERDRQVTKDQPRVRRTLSGKTVPVDTEVANWFEEAPEPVFPDPVPRNGAFYVRERSLRSAHPRSEENDRASRRRAYRAAYAPEVPALEMPVHRGAHYGMQIGAFPNRAAYRGFVKKLKGVRRTADFFERKVARVY